MVAMAACRHFTILCITVGLLESYGSAATLREHGLLPGGPGGDLLGFFYKRHSPRLAPLDETFGRFSRQGQTSSSMQQLCAPGQDSVECFENILRLWILRTNKEIQKQSDWWLWHICGMGVYRLRCFQWYMTNNKPRNQMYMEKKGQPGDGDWMDADVMYDLLNKDSGDMTGLAHSDDLMDGSWDLCPDGSTKVECFDNYMALWLSTVGNMQEGQRTFGSEKRSSEGVRVPCPPEDKSLDCVEYNLSVYLRFVGDRAKKRPEDHLTFTKHTDWACSPSDTIALCYARRAQRTLEWLQASKNVDKRAGPSKRWDMCPSGLDSERCFDYMLHIYTRMRTDNDSSKEYVG